MCYTTITKCSKLIAAVVLRPRARRPMASVQTCFLTKSVRGMRHKQVYTCWAAASAPETNILTCFTIFNKQQFTMRFCHWCTANPSGLMLYLFRTVGLPCAASFFSAIWWAMEVCFLFLTSLCTLCNKNEEYSIIAPTAGAFMPSKRTNVT